MATACGEVRLDFNSVTFVCAWMAEQRLAAVEYAQSDVIVPQFPEDAWAIRKGCILRASIVRDFLPREIFVKRPNPIVEEKIRLELMALFLAPTKH